MLSINPSGYKLIDHIEFTGTQYIELPFGFDNTDDIEYTFSIDKSELNDKYMIAPKTWNNNNNRFAMGCYPDGKYCVGYGAASTGDTYLQAPEGNTQVQTINDGLKHTWYYNGATKTFTTSLTNVNISRDCSSITWGGTTTNLRIGYGYNSPTKGVVYQYIHYKNGVLYAHLIPCKRLSDETYGLYDMVSKTFYSNSGTGKIVYEEYSPLEYIQSDGTQYINTGIKTSDTITSIYAHYNRTTSDKQQILFGAYNGSKYFYYDYSESTNTTYMTNFAGTALSTSTPLQSGDISTRLNMVSPEYIENKDYTFLDYIESDGTQEILLTDIGGSGRKLLVGPNVDCVVLDFQSTTTNQNGMIFANSNTTNHYWFYNYKNGNGIQLYSQSSGTQNLIGGIGLDTNRHRMNMKGDKFYIDGVLKGTESRTYMTSSDMYLFSWGGQYFWKGRIYSFKWLSKSGDIYSFCLIPAKRNSDGKIGLYNTITKKFLTSSVGNEFIAGPEKGNIKYKKVEYIETNGSQYTQIADISEKALVNCHIYNTSPSNNYLFGSKQDSNTMMANGLYSNNVLEYNYLTVSYAASNDVTMTQTLSGSNTVITINGVSKTVSSISANYLHNFFVGACNQGQRIYTGMRIYYFELYDASESSPKLVRDLIPVVRENDNVAGLYDKVSGAFFSSDGTSDFISSPSVQLTYYAGDNSYSSFVYDKNIGGNTNYYLFGDNSNGNFIYGYKCRLYSFVVLVDGSIYRDFIPYRRNTDGVCGVMDMVNNIFYTSPVGNSFAYKYTTIYDSPFRITEVNKNGVSQKQINSNNKIIWNKNILYTPENNPLDVDYDIKISNNTIVGFNHKYFENIRNKSIWTLPNLNINGNIIIDKSNGTSYLIFGNSLSSITNSTISGYSSTTQTYTILPSSLSVISNNSFNYIRFYNEDVFTSTKFATNNFVGCKFENVLEESGDLSSGSKFKGASSDSNVIGNLKIRNSISLPANSFQYISIYSIDFGRTINNISMSAFSSLSSLNKLVFNHTNSDSLTIELNSSNQGPFYYKTVRQVIIYTDNQSIHDHDWSTYENITATFYHLDGTAW